MSDTLTYLVDNCWTKDAEGDFISVEDAYAVPPVSLSVDGKSTQVTTTGKNLLSDIPSEWKKRTIPGVATRWVHAIPVEDGESYHFHDIGTAGFVCGWVDDLDDLSTYTNIITLTNRREYTFINSGNHPYLLFGISQSYSVTQVINTIHDMQLILEKGTSYTSYEPYTGGAASPRPDWPQEITSINVLMTAINGKNIVSPTTVASTKESNGITYEWDGEKLNASGTSTANNSDSMQVDIDNAPIMFAGTKYTFSLQGTFDTGASGTTFYFRTNKRGKTGQTLLYIFGAANKNTWTYTPTEDMVLRNFTLRISSSGNTVNISARLQLEIGATATEYEPYSGNSATIDLSNNPLRSLPDGTKDELHLTYLRPSDRPGWAWYDRELVKRVDELYFDGTGGKWSNVKESTADTNYVYAANNIIDSHLYSYGTLRDTNAYCDKFSILNVGMNVGKATTEIMGGSDNKNAGYALRFSLLKSKLSEVSASAVKAWFMENPITVDYPLLDGPQTISFDPIELPAMQSGLTNVWSDPSTNLSITYERDKNIVISNLKATIDDLATS